MDGLGPTPDQHIDAFLEAMRREGIDTRDKIVADGKLHRVHVEGHRRGQRNGWYVLHIDDGKPAGAFGDYKSGIKSTWTATGAAAMSKKERAELRKKSEADKKLRDAEEAKRQAAAAARAVEIWEAAAPDADHPYLTRKGVSSFGLRRAAEWRKEWVDADGVVHTKTVADALLIPLHVSKTTIVSLQAIFPDAKNALGRDKDFITDGRKLGTYFMIGAPTEIDGKPTILIGEGYATCASAHQATGLGAVVAFDVGNLIHVAKLFRERRPDLRILIIADDDYKTFLPVENPGWTYALRAAKAVGGDTQATKPWFTSREKRGTDFNDLHQAEGLDAVKRQILNALRGEPHPEAVKINHDVADPIPAPISLADRAEAGRKKAEAEGIAPDFSGIDERDNFIFLGWSGEEFWFYSLKKKSTVHFKASEMGGDGAKFSLADELWWLKTFMGDKGMNKSAALNWMIQKSYSLGVYDPRRTRGRGAWIDDGKLVYHFGDFLFREGKRIDVARIESKFIYPLKARLPAPAETALTDAEGCKLVDLAKMFRWTEPASYALACGWLALAPICGILKWRPHIWITGGVGSGKTTIIEDFMMKLLGEIAAHCKGASTEAGIRQELESDSRAVIMDESESNEESDVRRMQNILSLARQSSSDSKAQVLKGTATGQGQRFNVSSMFCFSSVGVGIKQQADHDRMAILALKPKRDFENTIDDWHKIEAVLRKIANDETIAARFLRRAIDLAPVTLANIKIFAEVTARILGTQREGDQYGALLAGCWSLMHSTAVTFPEAENFVNQFHLEPYVADSEVEESTKVVDAMFSFKIREIGKEFSVYELAAAAAGIKTKGCSLEAGAADSILERNGMRVITPAGTSARASSLVIANKHQAVNALFRGTNWEADWVGQLRRETALVTNWNNKSVKFNGRGSKVTAIALATILPEPADEEPPY